MQRGHPASNARRALLGASWFKDLRSSSKATEMVRFPSQSRHFSLPALNILFSLCASFTNVSTKIRSTPLKLYNPIPPRMTADGLPPCAMFSTCTVALGNARCNHCFQRAGQAQSFPAIPRFEALCQQSPPSVNEPPNTWQRSAKTYCLGASPW